MAFGIPGSENSGAGAGPFLNRIQFDARSGFWKIVRRIQDAGGNWMDDESEPFQKPSLLIDFGSFEVGYAKLTKPPAFLFVPFGHAYPPRPQEMIPGDNGKPKHAFMPGARLKVASPKTFGDGEAYFWTTSSSTGLTALETLHNLYLAAPEAQTGKIPVCVNNKNEKITISNKHGTQTFYAPTFDIVGWQDRLPVFGDRTVDPPAPRAGSSAPAAPSAPPPNHVPPPQAAKPAPAPQPAMAEEGMPDW